MAVWRDMKKPALNGGLEQVTAGAGTLPKLYNAAALRVLHAGELIKGDLRAAHIITLGAVFNDGIREALATPRAYDVSAILRRYCAEGQTCVKVAFQRCRDDGGNGGLCTCYNVDTGGAAQGKQIKQRRITRLFDVRAGHDRHEFVNNDIHIRPVILTETAALHVGQAAVHEGHSPTEGARDVLRPVSVVEDMRQSGVFGQLTPLRVDQDQPHAGGTITKGGVNHAVDDCTFTAAGAAGDQDMNLGQHICIEAGICDFGGLPGLPHSYTPSHAIPRRRNA